MMTGHWQGQGEPCNPSLSLGDLRLAQRPRRRPARCRAARRDDYFEDRGPHALPRHVPEPGPAVRPSQAPRRPDADRARARRCRRTTRFVSVQSHVDEGRRAAAGARRPAPVDAPTCTRRRRSPARASSPARSTAATASASRKSVRAVHVHQGVPRGGRYAEPVTTMTVEIRTSSKRVRGHRRRRLPAHRPDLRFPLDKRLYNDFERGDATPTACRSTSAVRDGLTRRRHHARADREVARRRGGGWKLRGVKLVVNGRRSYARDGDRALAGGRPPHLARAGLPAAARPAARRCRSRSTSGTRTRSSTAATITATSIATTCASAWRWRTCPGRPLRDRRATGGSSLSGRLGDGDGASITYTIETLTPTRRARRSRAAGRGRRRPPPTPPPAPKPDLVISAMGYDATAKYFFTVTNQGAGAARRVHRQRSRRRDRSRLPAWRRARRRRGRSARTCKVATQQAIADSLEQVAETRRGEQHAQLHRDRLPAVTVLVPVACERFRPSRAATPLARPGRSRRAVQESSRACWRVRAAYRRRATERRHRCR